MPFNVLNPWGRTPESPPSVDAESTTPDHPYPVMDADMYEGATIHKWADHTPRSAMRHMSDLLETLNSRVLLDSAVLMAQFKPFAIESSVSNTEFEPLFRKMHAVWEGIEEHVSTHQLHQFYGLVVGDASTHVPYITTIRDTRVSWFVNRPGTDEWTSVRHNMQTPDDAERFARSFLYRNASERPGEYPPPRPVVLRTANRSDLDNIINAANVMGPTHQITKRIVSQWITDLVHQQSPNARVSDRLATVFDQIDFMPTS